MKASPEHSLYPYNNIKINIDVFSLIEPWEVGHQMVMVTFDLENSNVKVMAKVRPIRHIWGLKCNRYVCFSFRGNRTTFDWDIYSKFHIWPWKFKVKVRAKVKPIGHIWDLEFNRYVYFSFLGNQSIFCRDTAKSIFDLENSRSWPWSNPMVTFEG